MSETREKARALLAAATRGPDEWRVGNNEDGDYVSEASNSDPRYRTTICQLGHAEWDERNAALIAAAPNLIATLCDENDALRARIARLEARGSRVCQCCDGTGRNINAVCMACSGSGAVIAEGA